MKVGTDGVLLGAWTDVKEVRSVLDIGTGTGLLAMMIAQRCEAAIDAVEIDKDAFDQARENIKKGPWKDRIQLFNASIQDFYKTSNKKYDLIICNPPYFQNSLKAPDSKRTAARHTVSLPFSILVAVAAELLTESGRFSVIIPAESADEIIELAEKKKLFPSRILNIFPAPGKPVKRKLIEFHIKKGQCKEEDLIIETEGRHQYSDAFKTLTKDFYLDK